MSIQSRISAISDLGHLLFYITNNQFAESKKSSRYELLKEEALSVFRQAEIYNPWFTQENINHCVRHWGEILTEENLTNWVKSYGETERPKTVGIIMAGNLPLVGLHDLLSVLISGHNALVKTSSKDDVLMSWVIDFLQNTDKSLEKSICKTERLHGQDAVIATGSNNTARYFEYYFQKIPHIIRKNRTSVAVLNETESEEVLKDLGEDIFRYFGLGCRNITKIYLPKGYNTDLLFEAFYDWNPIINHVKYANNYDYNRAVYLMNKESFLDNNFVILRQSESLHSPIGVVHYDFYEELQEVEDWLNINSEQIQCVASNIEELNHKTVLIGQTQMPSLTDYADNIDTIKFLKSL